MRAAELIARLQSRGATLTVEGPDLRVRAPRGILSDVIRAELLARKDEIIWLLRSHPCMKCGRFAFPNPNTLCYLCGGGLPDPAFANSHRGYR